MRSIIVASIFAFAAHAAELHPHAAEVAPAAPSAILRAERAERRGW